jgi:hypothetical protein
MDSLESYRDSLIALALAIETDSDDTKDEVITWTGTKDTKTETKDD